MTNVAVIGGGLAGISCALHLAEHGIETELFEAAPHLGGRTRSFYDRKSESWVDNGPHLLIGAYKNSISFFEHYGITNIAWQHNLNLPLWDAERGHFILNPKRLLPLPSSLAWAVGRLPGHSIKSLLAVLKLGTTMRQKISEDEKVSDWLHRLRIPAALQRDLLFPLCLGVMNEPAKSAPAATFARVLNEAFSNHDSACLGWFTNPMAPGMLETLKQALESQGVHIHFSCLIKSLHQRDRSPGIVMRSGKTRQFDYIVLCLPAHARNRLLGQGTTIDTRPITNIHFWFDEDLQLPHPFVGGIGTLGHWYFDIDQQMPENAGRYRHFCAVISAKSPDNHEKVTRQLCGELSLMLGRNAPLRPAHERIVQEQRATTLTRSYNRPLPLPDSILDASEQPQVGELPATIEYAIRRGIRSAVRILECK